MRMMVGIISDRRRSNFLQEKRPILCLNVFLLVLLLQAAGIDEIALRMHI